MIRFSLLALTLLMLAIVSAAAVEHELRYKAPDATTVDLMSDANGWKAIPMTKGNDGVWTVSVPMSPGTHGYKFLVNGRDWVFDPENSARTKVDGIENSAVEISGTSLNVSASATPLVRPSSASSARLTGSLSTPPVGGGAVRPELSPTPGEILIVEVPLPDKRRAEAAKEGGSKLMHARMAISVPSGFDPARSWPTFVVANTEAYSNIDSLRQFKQAANDEGWVIIAADGVELEKNKEGSVRWPCLAAALDYLTAAWPGMKDWPMGCGGMSGGAKNSSFLAADLVREHHRVIGILLMGCNQDMATVAYRRAGAGGLLNAAVFLSSGKSDTIATPAHHEAVKNSLQHTGFRQVRLEHFDGAHDIYQPHITEALRWFVAQTGPNPATQSAARSSEFDKFFKKKP
jgi:hypothetical protein